MDDPLLELPLSIISPQSVDVAPGPPQSELRLEGDEEQVALGGRAVALDRNELVHDAVPRRRRARRFRKTRGERAEPLLALEALDTGYFENAVSGEQLGPLVDAPTIEKMAVAGKQIPDLIPVNVLRSTFRHTSLLG